MMTAQLFEIGNSQAVRLPKECQFKGTEVAIAKYGEAAILIPKDGSYNSLLQSLDIFTEDYMAERAN
ncbi:MAG: AbrB/MazE/SpoVT family DNA-binding domain-containing protein [Lachnospiraceae bacterium]|nr:AbrB/MazE/SpoVT family DNA-binding domain-containing protein [Lachnospiraceae bacterium]